MASDKPINQYSHLPEKTTIYHSELVRACAQTQKNSLKVRQKSGVMKSTYGPDRDYVIFNADGDNMDHKYQLENEAIRQLLTICPQGVTLFWRAEAGTMRVWNEQGQEIAADGSTPAPAQQNQPPRAAAATSNGNGNGNAPAATGSGNGRAASWPNPEDRASLGDEMYAALCTANSIIERFSEEHDATLTEATLWSMTASLFIENNKSDGRRKLPMTVQHDNRGMDAQLDAAARSMGPPPPAPSAPRLVPSFAASGAGNGSQSPFATDDDLPF